MSKLDCDTFKLLCQNQPECVWSVYEKLQDIKEVAKKVVRSNDYTEELFHTLEDFKKIDLDEIQSAGVKDKKIKELQDENSRLKLQACEINPVRDYVKEFNLILEAKDKRIKELEKEITSDPRNDHCMFHRSD